MTQLVYLLEDDTDIAKLIARTLTQHGFRVKTFRWIAEFEREIQREMPDLCLIDLSLPDGDALSLVKDGVLPKGIPKLIVTGRGNLTDRVVGLEIGADDYIVKPFEPREMLARIRAVMRRSGLTQKQTAAAPKTIAAFSGWIVDIDGCTLTNAAREVTKLSSSEARLLSAFVHSAGRVLSRSQLLDVSGGNTDEPFDRSIDARISRLRRKLGDDPRNPEIIRTVYGAGYVLSQKVNWISQPE
jgi:two-component system, OmpR family, response regulator